MLCAFLAALLSGLLSGCAPLPRWHSQLDSEEAAEKLFEAPRVYPRTATPRGPQPRLFNENQAKPVTAPSATDRQASLGAPATRLPAVEPVTAPVPEKVESKPEVVPAVATNEAKAEIKPVVATKEVAEPNVAEPKVEEPKASPSDKPVEEPEQAKPPEYTAGDWLKQRDRAMSALQDEIRLARADKDRSGEVAQLETLLRLHQALAGQRDAAATPVAELRGAEQEFWRHEAIALVDLLGPDRLPTESRRFAVALKSLEEAESQLAAAGSLTLRSLAVCKKVIDFGVVEKFERYDFTPNQEVLLYVEVRNFAAQRNNERYETELQGSFRVLDRSGTARAERSLPLDKQSSANLRRDYYIAYRLYIPSELTPGSYTLELTIEDKKGNKSNNALLDINVK